MRKETNFPVTPNGRLKKVRSFLGKTQSEMARSLGISLRTYQYLEKDGATIKSNLLKTLLEKYEIDINWMLGGYGDMFLPLESYYKKYGSLRDQPPHKILDILAKLKGDGSDKKVKHFEELVRVLKDTGSDL